MRNRAGERRWDQVQYSGLRKRRICLKLVCTEVITEAGGIHDISERETEHREQSQGQNFSENLYLRATGRKEPREGEYKESKF